jgi:glutamate N-acetyltransferase / amino-acid N-acetyltransferase
MAVSYHGLPQLPPISGVRVATASAGIKKPDRKDLVLFELEASCSVAATFTRNLFCAAPVVVAKEHLQGSTPRYLIINTGNANAGTGPAGYNNAVSCCRFVADATDCVVEEVLPFSTGVIGEPLPVERIQKVIPELVSGLGADNWSDAATAILTTDTVPKGATSKVMLSGGEVTITGIAKGSGMIRPDMATMLAFVATDAVIENSLLHRILHSAVNKSFNRITVDGDTSTNDACVLIASGVSGVEVSENTDDFEQFSAALSKVMITLAQQIVKDGEGATKFVTINVADALNEDEGNIIAYTIAHSPLVKTALFASDPNWGRILAAVGRAGINDLDISKVNIHLGDVCIIRNGEPDALYTEEHGQKAMAGDEILIRVELGRGDSDTTVWTCDFSYDYVKINAEYRS